MQNQSAVSPGEARFIDGVFVYRDTQRPGTWRYVPPCPQPETDIQGRPTAQLWITGTTAILQLGARWTVAPASLDRIRQQLITESRTAAGMNPNLQPAPASITKASLTLNQGQDDPLILASSTTSGTPPWAAIFNATISPQLLPQVRAAFENDDPGTLVSYHIEFSQWLPVRAQITGDARQDVIELSGQASAETARRQIDTALENGRLKLKIESPPGIVNGDLHAVTDEVRTIAASLLVSMASQNSSGPGASSYPDAACLTATAHRQTSASVSFTSSTTLCSWFPHGTGHKHVKEIGPEENK